MKRLFAILLICALCLLCACGSEAHDGAVRIGALTGPTAMGLVKLRDDGENALTENEYEFTLKSEAAAFGAALASGELHIAAVPANLAAVIYNNTKGAVKILAVNVLGVLYIVERGESVTELSDLSGRTLYAAGEGAVPEFTLRYLTDGLSEPPDIHWCADTTEVLSRLTADENALAMLPQPFVTVAQGKIDGLRIALDLNALWEQTGCSAVTGVIAANAQFAAEHPDELETFMNEYAASVNLVLSDADEAARLIGKYEIVPEAVAKKALPACNICCISGDAMMKLMREYYGLLFDIDPASTGGSLPDGGLYYVG